MVMEVARQAGVSLRMRLVGADAAWLIQRRLEGAAKLWPTSAKWWKAEISEDTRRLIELAISMEKIGSPERAPLRQCIWRNAAARRDTIIET